MNCSACGHDDFEEVVLFTSVERKCRVCDMRRIVKECLDSPNIWSLPDHKDYDIWYKGCDFGFAPDGPIMIDPGVNFERIYDYHDHGMQPDMLLLDPVTFGAYKKLFGDK